MENDRTGILLLAFASFSFILLLFHFTNNGPDYDHLWSYGMPWLYEEPMVRAVLILAVTSGFAAITIGKMDSIRLRCICAAFFLLLTIGFQAATISPVGPDGFGFAALSELWLQYGSTTSIEGYLGYPGSLAIVASSFSIGGRTAGLLTSSIFAIAAAAVWIWVVVGALQEEDMDQNHRLLPWFIMFLSLYALTIYPFVMFSAQLLAFSLYAWLAHRGFRSGADSSILVWTCLGWLVLTHEFAPVILLFVLLSAARPNAPHRRSAGTLSAGLLILWTIQSFVLEKSSILDSSNSPTAVTWTIACSIAAITIFHTSRLAWRDDEIDQSIGVDQRSLIISIAPTVVLLLFLDLYLQSYSFTRRVVIYGAVPIGKIVIGTPVFNDIQSLISNWSERAKSTSMVAVIILASVFASVVHVKYSDRVPVFPIETFDCWELAEEVGVGGFTNVNITPGILISPFLNPPIEGQYDPIFDRFGEGKELERDKLGAVIETVDMDFHAAVEGTGPFWDGDDWVKMGEVIPACQIHVRLEMVPHLQPGVWPLPK